MIGIQTSALNHDLTIPFKTESLERTQDPVCRSGDSAPLIDVLNAQQPLTVAGPRIKIASDRCNERTKMQRTGRRRCKTSTVKETTTTVP